MNIYNTLFLRKQELKIFTRHVGALWVLSTPHMILYLWIKSEIVSST